MHPAARADAQGLRLPAVPYCVCGAASTLCGRSPGMQAAGRPGRGLPQRVLAVGVAGLCVAW
jgi:hypothetical protein